jgi:hypothetical protein
MRLCACVRVSVCEQADGLRVGCVVDLDDAAWPCEAAPLSRREHGSCASPTRVRCGLRREFLWSCKLQDGHPCTQSQTSTLYTTAPAVTSVSVSGSDRQ